MYFASDFLLKIPRMTHANGFGPPILVFFQGSSEWLGARFLVSPRRAGEREGEWARRALGI